MSSNTYAFARMPIIQRPQGYYLRWYYNGWHYWQFFGAALGYTTEGEKYRTTGTRNVALNSGQLNQIQVEGLRTILNTTEVYLLTDKGWMVVRIEQGTAKVYDNQFSGYEMLVTIIVGSRLPSMATGYSPVVPPVIVPAGSLCETVIGTQVWLCKNWDAAYPASKVYNNDEANRAKFGGLYTYDQVNSAGFVPEGWDFPTIEQWRTLIAYVGGAAIAGGKLKQAGTTNWQTPNAGADNAFGFDGLAGGYFGIVINEDWSYRADFANLYRFGYFWAKSPEGTHMCFLLSFDTGEVIELPYVPAPDPAFQPYHSVRFIKSTPYNNVVTDIDNNIYHTVIIGRKEYIVENLKVTKFGNGDNILNIESSDDWVKGWMENTTPAYCWFNNDITNKSVYGALYNHHTLEDSRGLIYLMRNGIHEVDWRLMNDADFTELIDNYGGQFLAGGDCKEIGTDHWLDENVGATNLSRLKFVGSGMRNLLQGPAPDYVIYMEFQRLKERCVLWSSDLRNDGGIYYADLYHVNYNDTAFNAGYDQKVNGCSVRAVRDL